MSVNCCGCINMCMLRRFSIQVHIINEDGTEEDSTEFPMFSARYACMVAHPNCTGLMSRWSGARRSVKIGDEYVTLIPNEVIENEQRDGAVLRIVQQK